MADGSKSLRLWQEILLTLALKVVLLTLIWFAWFSTPEDRSLDDQKISSKFFSSSSVKETVHDAVPRAR